MLATTIALVSAAALAQPDFQIVWVRVGEAATQSDAGQARAGRRLFDAGDLASLSMNNVRITRIDAEPVVSHIRVGEQWCLSRLHLSARDADQQPAPSAPLSVTVRQDQREHLGIRRSRKDICVRPNAPGEYPIRLTSLLPAPDGSMRGAQVFVRVSGSDSASSQTASDH